MRLAMVQLVLTNLKSFYPMAGYDLLGKHKKKHHTPSDVVNIQDVDKCCPIFSPACLIYLRLCLCFCSLSLFLTQICLWALLCVTLY